MGSKPSKSSGGGKPQKENKVPLGMSPGQSMAMAGNTGLTGISGAQANTIIQANKQLNKTFDLNRPDTFQALGQTFGEQGSKYLRPADKQLYAQEMQTVAEGLAAGATPFIGQDGIERLNFNNLGIKDETGATILSKQLPGVTATPPTLGQLGGDVSRAITGYNSLQYTDPTSNVTEMVRTQGLADVLAKAAIPGSTAFKIVKDLYGKGKDFFFPGEEEEEEEFQSLIPRDITIEERVSTPITEKANVVPKKNYDPDVFDFYSSGADAFDDKARRDVLRELGTFEDRTRFDQVAEPVQELPDFLTGSSGRDKPKVLDLREIMGESGGNQGGGNENQQTTPSDPPNRS
jgi:hypothetical protein